MKKKFFFKKRKERVKHIQILKAKFYSSEGTEETQVSNSYCVKILEKENYHGIIYKAKCKYLMNQSLVF